MSSAIQSFEQQKQQALAILSNLSAFVQEGRSLGIHVHPDLVTKLQKSVQNATEQKLKVALIGGFSEGKTSIAAAWLEELDRKSMNTSQGNRPAKSRSMNTKTSCRSSTHPGCSASRKRPTPQARKSRSTKTSPSTT